MELKLQKWGNSYGIRIPKVYLKSLNINNSDSLMIEQNDNKIIISKSKKQKISLAEKFKNYHGDNLAKEFNWDEPIGEELW